MANKLMNKLMVAWYKIPWVKARWARSFDTFVFESTPWTPLGKPLEECKVALLTTGGVHLRTDMPFDMLDKDGDPTFRRIPSGTASRNLIITHDYYDHDDADQDINLVLPIDIVKKAHQQGLIGDVSDYFYSFMGHIAGPHLVTLMEETAIEVAKELVSQQADVAVFVPA